MTSPSWTTSPGTGPPRTGPDGTGPPETADRIARVAMLVSLRTRAEDHFHPDECGHAAIAATFRRALSPARCS